MITGYASSVEVLLGMIKMWRCGHPGSWDARSARITAILNESRLCYTTDARALRKLT
jgi:hypothetical protein